MSTIAELEKAVSVLRLQRDSLEVELRSREYELRKLKSKRFIELHSIRAEHVYDDRADGTPWFGHVQAFADWLKDQPWRRYAVWNGQLHLTSELIVGKFIPTEGEWDDVPKDGQ